MREKRIYGKWLVAACLCLAASGCASVISETLIAQVDPTIEFQGLFKEPERYTGKTVLLGGVIVSTRNRASETVLEIVQKPVDYEKRPRQGDETHGRFRARYDGYLDPAIYAEGREVTVAGTVQGKREQALGEMIYTYPLIRAEEIYLWPPRAEDPLYHYPPGGWYYSPWWHPYWGPW